tara:strand:- start:259 stop:1152 length:894 start_codon:yes stop_codon:yes gene_type:complete
MKQIETKNIQNINKSYYCELCDYTCIKKHLWTQHLSTQKHILKQNETKNMQIDNKKNIFLKKDNTLKEVSCIFCNRVFNSRTTLWRHKKKCEKKEDDNNITSIKQENNVILTLLNENKKLIDAMKEMSSKVGNNNNNNINIQVFLNEKCKDAINISDFINSLQITLEDLNVTKEKGLIEGISNIMISGLKQLDVYKRPFHCTDLKRDVLYVKDQKWEKDVENVKIKESIAEMARKQVEGIKEWKNANPNWMDDENMQEEYVKLISETFYPLDKDEKAEKKIIKNITKEIHLPKQDII